jgi:sugar phosphate isomerase/epimerase
MPTEKAKLTRRALAGGAAMAAATVQAVQAGPTKSVSTAKSDAGVKLGLYSITYLGVWYNGAALTVEEVIDRAKKFGYDGVEIDGKRPHGDPLDLSKYQCRTILRHAEAQGIEIYAVAGNNDFSSPMPEYREAQAVYMRELIRMTADLEVKVLRVFLAWPGVTLNPEGGARYDIAGRIWAESHRDFPEERVWDWCRAGLKEAASFANDHGITLALQNHRPVIRGYRDVQRMINEVAMPNVKACFDARLEHEMTPEDVIRVTREFGALQVLSHYGNEYSEDNGKVVPKEDELMPAQVQGLVDIGYKGYLGFELCHPLPRVDGKLVGIDFVDKNARIAAQYGRQLIAEANKS